MTTSMLLLRATLLALLFVDGAALSSACTPRRAVLRAAAAVAAAPLTLPLLPATAAQRGAEPAYKVQSFDDSAVCTRRTPLGACADTAPMGSPEAEKVLNRDTGAVPMRVLQAEPEAESDLVKSLLKKSAENAEANAQLVKEKTIRANQYGQFGPFSSETQIMRQDGSFDIVSIKRFDKLKDRGKLTKTKTGLDIYVKGFDPDAPEPKEKLFGLF